LKELNGAVETEERWLLNARRGSCPRDNPYYSHRFCSHFFLTILAVALIFSLITLSPSRLSAQLGPHLLFRTLSIEQGLSQNSVLSIARDRFGFLWFGTESGLNKFDGYHFTVYLPIEGDPASLSNSWINVLLTDRSGDLWIGTENGLNRYAYSTDSFIRYFHSPSDPNSLSSSRIFALYEDRAGNLWIGTDDGLNLFDRTANRFIRYRYDPANPTSLSYNQIRAITEDSRGFIWVGTVGGGLNRLDPATGHFTRIRHDPTASRGATLPDDYILSLLITPGSSGSPASPAGYRSFDQPPAIQPPALDSSKSASPYETHETLWVGTIYSGLVAYDLATGEFKIYRHNPDDPTSISDNTVNCLMVDPAPAPASGTTYRTTTGTGASSSAPSALSSSTTPLSSTSSSPIPSVPSASFSIWVGTNAGGLCQFIPSRGAFISYRHLAHDPLSLADNRVVSLFLDPERILWAGTYRGTSQLNLHRQNFMRFLSDPFNQASLSHPEVRSFYETDSGLLYVGTDGAGIDVFDQNRLRIKNFRHDPANPGSLSSNRVFCLTGDHEGFIWAGTLGGGLSRLNPATSTFTRYRHNPHDPTSLPDNMIRSLLVDSQNRLWVGGNGGGLALYDRSTGRFLRPVITKFVHLKAGETPEKSEANTGSATGATTAAATGAATGADLSLTSNPLLSGRIFSMAEARSHAGHLYLWIACFGDGLIRYDPASGEVFQFTQDPLDPHSLSNNFAVSVLVDHTGCIWVGTNGGGLCRLDPTTSTFTRFSEAQGLPSSVFYGLLEDDDGYIWLSSNRGLSRLDPRTRQIKNFDTTDGLQSYEFNGNACLKCRHGYLYFGGINGFNAFNPREIKTSTYLPPVVVTNFMISNVPVKPGHRINDRVILEHSISETQSLELDWKHRVIAFEFAGLDYTSPEKNQYAYILEGFDRDWNYVGTRRFASYSNLPPGHYTFRVKASNSDGLWNEAGTSLSLRIIPPFWRTWWFYSLAFLVFIGIVYGSVRYRLDQIKRSQRELERLVAQRTEELRLANDKLQLLAITDELTGLANYRRFRDFLEYEWRRARRTKRPVSLIICDLDNFKLFNDTYGHQAGDECLKKVALEMLRCCQRSSDLACRYGGDEFAVVLPETDAAGAYIVAERIREAVAGLHLSDLGLKKINGNGKNRGKGWSGNGEERGKEQAQGLGQKPNQGQPFITACLGLATMNPAEGGDTNELVARADEALYRAKSSGKNLSLL
jgi:diguanylate cyclase (GGDEF)-like protein